jgi:hypothetical protein
MSEKVINNIRVFKTEFVDSGPDRQGPTYRSSVLMTIKGLYLTATSAGEHRLRLILENSGVSRIGEDGNRQPHLEIGEFGNRHDSLRLHRQRKVEKSDVSLA